MNHDLGQVKEEYAGASSSYSGMESTAIPQPMEGLHDAGPPPPFLTKTYDIVEDTATNHIVSWSRGNNSFVVWDPQTFSMSLLPRYFKHNNFSSFVRQLNTYGFRKVDPDRWEFANEGFLRGQKHLLKDIRRRRAPQPQSCQQCLDPCVEVERFGVDGEVDRLRRDKQVLMMELLKLRQQQQNTKACLQLMEHKLKRTETKQQQMMGFLARAIQNPNFVQKLIQQKDRRKELEEAFNKKRRRPIDQGHNNVKFRDFDHIGGDADTCIKIELQEFDDLPDFEASELGALAMTLQDVSGSQQNLEEECKERGEEHKDKGKDLDEGFWDELLNQDIGDEMVMCGEAEDVDVLVEQLGYLGSSPK